MTAIAGTESTAELGARVLASDRRALAKAITLVESTRPEDRAASDELLGILVPHAGRALRVGVSGAPGVGKSTFIDAFGETLVDTGLGVAVLAVDPSSSLTGGSILGDRTRMGALASRPQAFIRQSPSSGSLGGVARRTREAILVCDAAGFDRILVETVGVGQSEIAVASMVDVFVLLLMPGAGDELQGIKRGILELADLVLINKADGEQRQSAERFARTTAGALELLRPSRGGTAVPAVLAVSALERRGMDAVAGAIADLYAELERSGELAAKRAAQRRAWLDSAVNDALESRFYAHPDVAAARTAVTEAVDRGEITPTEGARRLLALAK